DCQVLAGQPQNGCSFTFPGDALVTLTATPDPGATFAGWGAACASAGTAGSCVLDASQPRTIAASFTAEHRLTVSVSGTGAGTVSSAPGGIACTTSGGGATCGATYT